MNVNELLAMMPPKRVEQLERSELWRFAADRNLAWAEAVLDRGAAKEACSRLSAHALEALRMLLLTHGAAPAEEEALLARLRGSTALTGSECRIALRELETAGLLFAVKKVWGERLCFVPADIYARWLPLLLPLRLQPVAGQIDPPVGADGQYSDVPLPFGRRMLYGLSVLAQADTAFTGKGLLAKKTVARLSAAMRFDAAALRPFRLEWAHSGHYPLETAMFLEAALAFGLIEKEEKGLRLRQEGLEHWLRLTERSREHALREWLCGRLLAASGPAGHPAAALLGMEEGVWYERSGLEEWNTALLQADLATAVQAADGANPPHGGGTRGIAAAGDVRPVGVSHDAAAANPLHDEGARGVAATNFLHGEEAHGIAATDAPQPGAERDADWSGGQDAVSRWLNLFCAFGWLEPGEVQQEGRRCAVFRWRPLGATNRTELIVQPDGELLAGPDCGYAVRWELELIGERLMDEQFTVYAMTSDTIARAIEHGRTKASIARFLKNAGDLEELPPSVESMLDEWTERAGRYTFAEATLLRCDTEQLADWAAAHPVIAPLLQDRIGALYFVVESGSVSEIRRMLGQAGYPARKGIMASIHAEGSEPSAYLHIIQEPPEAADSTGTTDRTETMDNRSEAADKSAETADESAGAAICLFPGKAGAFLYELLPVRHYELDDVPDRASASEGLRQAARSVPSMWLRQLHSYHWSTRKEMIQKALALETSVQLKVDGELKRFIPDALEQRGGQWAVMGRLLGDNGTEVSRLTPDMWEEMRLVIPEGLAT